MTHTSLQQNLIRLAAILFAVCMPACVHAANYSVSPLLIDHELKKRDIKQEIITLTNKEDRVIRVFPTVNEVSVNEGGTVKGFIEPSMLADRANSITSWLEIGRGRIELQPGETKEVTLTIRVNPEVQAGEYHAFVGFPEGSNRPEAEAKVANGQAPGTVVRIGVDKVQNQFLRLEKFAVDRFVKDPHEGDVTFTLVNPGEDPVVPSGEIIFYNNRGNEVGSVKINTETTTIEAGKEAAFTSKVPDVLKMGKYKAFLSVEYGDHQTASLNDTAFFYVLPLWQILIIFVVVLAVALFLALYVHKRYDGRSDDDGTSDVAMYLRESRSESKEHDIDLSKKNGN